MSTRAQANHLRGARAGGGRSSRRRLTGADVGLAPGLRVQLRGDGGSFRLVKGTGTVIGPDPRWDGYWVVRLDEPATYFSADGTTEPLTEIVQADDNLFVLSEPPGHAAG